MCKYGSEESSIDLKSHERAGRFNEKPKRKYKLPLISISILKIPVIYFKYFIIYPNRDMLK